MRLLRQSLAACRSIRDEVGRACRELSRDRVYLGTLSDQEREIWLLLSDASFQELFADWLMAGSIAEGNSIRAQLMALMERALHRASASEAQIADFRAQYLELLDRTIFKDQMLAAWRHQLSLDYLREQVTSLRQLAEEAAGIYPPERQQAALECYVEEALKTWDIIDLSNLPEGDIHIATQKLLLRQLYMPLRVTVEVKRDQDDDSAFEKMEQRRAQRRLTEAGRGELSDKNTEGMPIGTRLAAAQRLVVLGDPGGGKTTLLRWMATAYLLREREPAAYTQLPDVDTLPDQACLPVLIRCRDLGEADLCRSFTDFLAQHLLKSALRPEEAEVMNAVILEQIAAGHVLLLIDGLDEITNPQVRVQFCQELERTATRYPATPMIVTSRVVGYRDMPYRMGRDFEHTVIADLRPEDRDLFARRWIAITEQHQPEHERAERERELIAALHANDRIERLTGNPMLLTTLALIKRKVGKLPSRRNKLYEEAVAVLLNWNPRLYKTIDENEAIPQLAYLAYEMCRRGVQRLPEDDVLELLDRIRNDYPNLRSLRQRTPEQFLELLEARSSILIKSGGEWNLKGREQPVWEFRHLTFQEYLAARALVEGRYPDRDRNKTLAEVIAPLVGTYQQTSSRTSDESEFEISDSWQEALRLLVASCNDDDVDEVLLAIASPLENEDPAQTIRPRLMLAARCLADEPNVSETVALDILNGLVLQISDDSYSSPIVAVIEEIGHSIWKSPLKNILLHEYFQRSSSNFSFCGGMFALLEFSGAPQDEQQFSLWFTQNIEQIQILDHHEAVPALLATMYTFFKRRDLLLPHITSKLINLLRYEEPVRHSASWVLMQLYFHDGIVQDDIIISDSKNIFDILIKSISLGQKIHSETIYFLKPFLERVPDSQVLELLISGLKDCVLFQQQVLLGSIKKVARSLNNLGDARAIEILLAHLDNTDDKVQIAIISALGSLGDARAIDPLLAHLDNANDEVQIAIVHVLSSLGDARAVEPLLAHLDNANDEAQLAIVQALSSLGDARAVEPLLARLDNSDDKVQVAIVLALGSLGDARAVEPLLARLDDSDDDLQIALDITLKRLGEMRIYTRFQKRFMKESTEERQGAMEFFIQGCNQRMRLFLSRDRDSVAPWFDSHEVITQEHIVALARQLEVTEEAVQQEYEELAALVPLRLEWHEADNTNFGLHQDQE